MLNKHLLELYLLHTIILKSVPHNRTLVQSICRRQNNLTHLFPNASSKLKEFADDNFNFDEKIPKQKTLWKKEKLLCFPEAFLFNVLTMSIYGGKS